MPGLLVGAAVLYLALCALAWRLVLRPAAPERWSRRAVLTGWIAALLAGLLVRLTLAGAVPGLPNDIATFKAWAVAAAGGLGRFYGGPMFVDYPPGYVYVLAAVGRAGAVLGLAPESASFTFLVKLPAVFLDLCAAVLVFGIARRQATLARAAALSGLVALNPALVHDSAVFGQVDAFLAVPLAVAVVLAARGAVVRAAVAFTVAALVKPQALLLAPLALAVLLRRRDLRAAALALAASAATLVALLLPFSRSLDPTWVLGLYAKTLSSYPFASLNGANLHALLGANWTPLEGGLSGVLGAVGLAAVALTSAWLVLRGRELSAVLPVALLAVAASFLVSARMHERYLYPAVLLAAVAYARLADPRLVVLFAGFSTTVFLNEAQLHALVLRTGSFLIPADDVPLRLVALANLALVAVAAWVALAQPRARRADTGPGSGGPTGQAGAEGTEFTRRDRILAAGLTLACAVLAFARLGSHRGPESCWRPSRPGEAALLDLGAARRLSRITYHLGLGEGSYALDTSVDGRSFGAPADLAQGAFGMLEWRVLPEAGTAARFIRLTARRPGVALCEVAAFEGEGSRPLPLAPAAGPEGRTAAALVDEPATAVRDPSFLDGTVFDEVYYARAGDEIAHGLQPSETTHPPLGKLLVALGVAALGMNALGWRFVGALFGVAMVPLLHLFARRLQRRSDLAFLAALLLAADFMRFTLGRIANIDVFAAFFGLLAYFLLYEHLRRDLWRAPPGELLLPLLGSGAAFGLGVATKWSVLYGAPGLGLAILVSLAVRWRARRRSGAAGGAEGEGIGAAPAGGGRVLAVLACAAVSFVVLPAAIYLAAYVPFLRLPGAGHGLGDVLALQQGMYRYHAGMAQQHPFASPWWQWPLLVRPVWAYQGKYGLPPGHVASIVLMGNPAVWWPGLAAVPLAAWLAARRRDAGLALVLAGLASLYAPWAVAPRKLVFIYHFFPAVPFLILSTVGAARLYVDRFRAARILAWGQALAAVVLLAPFYPVLSGLPVPRGFVLHWLRWLGSWILC